jgi:uncharacterized RDD family membrane protein YckC
MSDDIYAVPEAELEVQTTGELIQATRMQRLLAAIVDGILLVLILVGLMFATIGLQGFNENAADPSWTFTLISALIGIALFLALNGVLLVKYGQTIGKRLLNIKITDLNGDLPTVKGHLLKRYGVYLILQHIPFVGPFLSIGNIVIIFGKKKRCGHDFAAGTIVLKCAK